MYDISHDLKNILLSRRRVTFETSADFEIKGT